jgi:pyridoxal phosphate enzyme (YggS family)
MSTIGENILALKKEIPTSVTLVAVSKTKPLTMLQEAYDAGQRVFGENYVQELCDKQPLLPADIQWHFIGHLQSNKVKYIAPFVHTIHAVDSEKLLSEINKQATKNNRVIHCLLQIHIADEETKFGFEPATAVEEISLISLEKYPHVRIIGLMGMASFVDDTAQVQREFQTLKHIFDVLKTGVFQNQPHFTEISMGMSGDWKMAIAEGSTMVRIGSSIFGNRN